MTSDFLDHLRANNYAETTVGLSEKWLKHFTDRYPVAPSQLKASDLTRYHKSLHWEPGVSGRLYSENTVNQIVGVLKSYFRWCIDQGHLKKCPACHIVTRKVPPKERTVLTVSQARKLFALPDLSKPLGLRDRAVLGLIVEIKASPRALVNLDLTDFQPDTGAMLLQGRTRRIVSLDQGLQTDLERYIRLGRTGYALPGETALFLSRSGAKMSLPGVQMILSNYCKRAQIPKPSFSS